MRDEETTVGKGISVDPLLDRKHTGVPEGEGYPEI